MAYRFRVYLPAAGIASANVYMGNSYQTTIHGDGSTSAKYDQSNITTSMTVRDVTLENGYAFNQWVINIDGATTYSSSSRLDIPYDSSYSNVQVRAEVTQVTTYYVTLNYSANGGSGVPGSQSGSSSTSSYVQFTIPNTRPTRTGYSFMGWSLSSTATTADYQPAGSITLWGSTSGESYTLYAVWQKTSGAGAYIHNSTSWQHYTPYIHNGTTWQEYEPHVYDSGW